MIFNAVPLLLGPGMALAGFLAGGWQGLGWGLGCWCALVVIGTAVFLVHRSLYRAEGALFDEGANRPVMTRDLVPPSGIEPKSDA